MASSRVQASASSKLHPKIIELCEDAAADFGFFTHYLPAVGGYETVHMFRRPPQFIAGVETGDNQHLFTVSCRHGRYSVTDPDLSPSVFESDDPKQVEVWLVQKTKGLRDNPKCA